MSTTPLKAPPLALYIHLPWCERKCPYCDFNSHTLAGRLPEDDYVAALLADLSTEADRAGGRRIETVFIGGGTPSLFSGTAIGRVLEAADRRIGLAGDVEITLESNPGSAEAARFRDYRLAGVNRLSIGVQSLNDQRLTALGRIHDGHEALAALDRAKAAGFERINADIMFGLPGQTLDEAVADVRGVLARGVDHVSHYELTLEPNTVFYSKPPERPDEESRWDMQAACFEALSQAGLERYEISAWSRPGEACRHNLNYWQFGDYLAIGAGAHGKFTRPAEGIFRHRKHRVPERYMQLAAAGEATVDCHALDAEQRIFEYMLNALRLTAGFRETDFEARCGLPSSRLHDALDTLREQGLMESIAAIPGDAQWRPTPRGMDFLNELQARFLPDREAEKAGP
ncbi:radical SAM family heme chaperone HemW [Natronospira sp. AB-CW4]|uniref:Heme chaperone HemW n=1 Tax=Natronospira bacteriovora TaxID=3069753 RepID=A0ABU0W825_9GAMM|nr:radical SAM family heme chaperone HemW [Natronospira sp. AB-CW4]MDQ2070197.1 radical SAM family heme chaperone HemW [Natronospira sp. AB-CW4]